MHLTPTERIIILQLQLHPGSTLHQLADLVGGKSPSHTRASLRTLVLAGQAIEKAVDGLPATYHVAGGAQ